MTPPSELCPPPRPIPRPLTGPELLVWIALRRVHTGRVAQFEGRYYDSGRRVPCFLPAVFDDLVKAGLLALAEPDPASAGLRRVVLTSEGRARFVVLSEQESQWIRRAGRTGREPVITVEAPVPTSLRFCGDPREMYPEPGSK